MKVALHLDGRSIRGSERQALLIASGLRDRGHVVVASCRTGGPVEAALRGAGIRTTGVRPRGDLDPVSALAFAAWLRREQPDALLLTSWKRVTVAGLAARIAGVPRVVMRMGGPHTTRKGIRGSARRTAFRRCYHAIVTNSTTVRDAVLADLGDFPPAAVPVIPNGVEVRAASPAPVRERLGVPADAFLLIAVGGLESLKGYDTLAGALGRTEPTVHLMVAGGGSEERRAILRRTFEAAGVADRIHFLGYRDDVPALLAAADAFVHASRIDSMPNAVLEAMASGTPVVATRVGGVEWALGPTEGRGPAGWSVPIDDEVALAGALSEVVAAVRGGEPGLDARVNEGRWRAAHWFDIDRMVAAYEGVLR